MKVSLAPSQGDLVLDPPGLCREVSTVILMIDVFLDYRFKNLGVITRNIMGGKDQGNLSLLGFFCCLPDQVFFD